jgi:hypothetical protein
MLEATRSFVFLVLLQTKNENERIKVSSISYSPGLFGFPVKIVPSLLHDRARLGCG